MITYKDLSLKLKIGIGVSSAVFLVLLIYSGIVIYKTETLAIQGAEQLALEMANRYGNQVKGNMESALDASLTLGAAVEGMVTDKSIVSRQVMDEMQKSVLGSNATFYGIQTCFEPNALDAKDAEFKATGDPMWEHMGGAYGNYWWKEGGSVKVVNLTKYDYPNTRAWYTGPRDSDGPSLTEPYYTEVAKTNMATISVPMKANGKFIGIVGIDFTLTEFQDMVDDIKPMGTGYSLIISNKGVVVAHPNPDMLNKEVGQFLDKAHSGQAVKAIQNGVVYQSLMESPLTGETSLFAFVPIKVRGTSTPWSIGIVIPEETIYEAANEFMYLSIMLTLLALVTIGVVVFFIARSISAPLSESVIFAETVAKGDLTFQTGEKDLQRKDEIGALARAMSNMATQLRQVVGEVRMTTDSVASGASELSSTSQALSSGATEQAASIEEVSSSMEEMASNISQNADNATQTQGLASSAAGQAADGGSAVSEAVEAMREIADKISIIEEIARQTNLLALNAAIEAARAGEHGKGFAVVAAEVRKLAERSGVAAGEISQLASSSVDVADRAGELLSKLVPDIQQTADLVDEITSASNEQNVGASQINGAIQQLDHVVQQNASASEEMSSTSEELSGQAAKLQQVMSFFKTDSNAGYSHTVAAVRQPVASLGTKPAPTRPAPGVALDMAKDDGEFERF